MKINEVIVVEGKNDSLRLKSFFDCDTIITSGLGLSKETIELIRKTDEERGVILLLDPDTPGEKIRQRINDAIPNLKNAFVYKEEAKTTKKVGIEHASQKTILKALESYITYGEIKDNLKMSDLMELGICGNQDLRYDISRYYHIGKCNNKTLLKRLNMLNIQKEDLKRVVNERNHR